ncbi:diaminopropionate ammonia-lyase [Roseospira marina]|uniref:diaminopropionate ammonia-lyase n=1 Tax=Roseospira marina TaxID=140057 RepID=UPI0017FA445F|nr:diaminopropionate ammonia-lyase [Roseospira marina]MBB4313176.1 diaminopropionate ammonia-lyase [Roseospira marina]MBB5086083.1 diaminopropionate ammonia-lyase [Roseospira marina]
MPYTLPLLSAHPVTHIANPRAADPARPIGPRERAVLTVEGMTTARDAIRAWEGYAPTPLRRLDGLAAAAGLAALYLKDESTRLGLGSFKALGGAYAVERLVGRRGAEGLTVCCATDGNHGRSVAWGAHRQNCGCVIYVHGTVSPGRCEAIARWGADVRRVLGTYDDSVRAAAEDAVAHGWVVVSDTSYPGYMNIPRDVMQGYTVMADEIVTQIDRPPTHIFVQGGVGGLAAAVTAQTWEAWGTDRPRIVVVEPDRAACLLASARTGRPVMALGALDTVMSGLACGAPSLLAWEVLDEGAHNFLAVPDAPAVEVMRLLASGRYDAPVVAGDSATAGLAGCLLALANPTLRGALGLDRDSRVLALSTEGATDPDVYAELVGRPAASVVAAS